MKGFRVATMVVIAIGVFIFAGIANAAVVVLDFEGLQNLESIANYYNGGLGGSGSGPGPNYGIVFSSDSLAIIDLDAGGSGNFGNEPSPNTVAFFLTGAGDTMNVAAGFDTGFSFFYSSTSYSGSVTVWDGLNGTGSQLASLSLAALGAGSGDPNGDFSNWAPIGVAFSGTAQSVVFSGVADQIAFDDITLGSAEPGEPGRVPEPSALLLLGSGLVGLVGYRHMKRMM